MATNAGIEVTQLRPQAQVRDSFVRPQTQKSGIQQGLARLAGNINKKQDAEARARAQEISISEAIDSADSLHNFEAYAHESPAVIANLKELRGNAWAAQWRTGTEDAYNEWKMNSAEDGGDFAGFMTERKRQLADVLKGDRFLTAGAMRVLNETEHNMRSAHRGFLDQRIRVETQENMTSALQETLYQLDKGTSGMTIDKASSYLDELVNRTHATGGMRRAAGNKHMFDQAISLYSSTGDERYKLLAENMKYAKGAKGMVTRPEAVESIADADARVSQRQSVQQALDAKKAKEDKEQAQMATMNGLFNTLLEGADPEEIFKMTMEARQTGLDMSKINSEVQAFRDAWAGDYDVNQYHTNNKAAVLMTINSNIGNPRGLGITEADLMDYIGTKDIHPDHVSELMSALKSAQQIAPLMTSAEVKAVRDSHVQQMRDSALFKSEDLSLRIGDYERGFNAEFQRILQAHYNVEGAGQPTTERLNEISQQAHAFVDDKYQAAKDLINSKNQWLSDINKATTLSADSSSYFDMTNDPELDNVKARIQTDEGQKILAKIMEDPMELLPTGDGGELPAWQVFDKQIGNGAFSLWSEHNPDYYSQR